MTTYKSYAECKIANPYSEIFCSIGGDFAGIEHVSLVALSGVNEGWNKCNPADHCSSLKEFLEAGFSLDVSDKFVGLSGRVYKVSLPVSFECIAIDSVYILSAAELNGGCKIPAKAEQWTVYNNTMPLCELSDEQAAMLFNAWRSGISMEKSINDGWSKLASLEPCWIPKSVYRIKPKSERELFIEAAASTFDGRTGLSEQAMSLAAQLMFDSGKFKLVIKDGE